MDSLDQLVIGQEGPLPGLAKKIACSGILWTVSLSHLLNTDAETSPVSYSLGTARIPAAVRQVRHPAIALIAAAPRIVEQIHDLR